MDKEMELGLREVKSAGILDDAVPADLEERREARKQITDERKMSGELISTTDVTETIVKTTTQPQPTNQRKLGFTRK